MPIKLLQVVPSALGEAASGGQLTARLSTISHSQVVVQVTSYLKHAGCSTRRGACKLGGVT